MKGTLRKGIDPLIQRRKEASLLLVKPQKQILNYNFSSNNASIQDLTLWVLSGQNRYPECCQCRKDSNSFKRQYKLSWMVWMRIYY